MSVYYNENDAHKVDWLQRSIARGLIPDGIIDTRSIAVVQPYDLKGFIQCHFFSGIGGWPAALRLAGWPDDRPIWTGSCPCGPFSRAGKKLGFSDPRHLWPEWERLISECRPAVIVGEQSADATDWLRIVRGRLDSLGYAVGAIPFEAASAGSEHRRPRFYFVADRDGFRRRLEQQQQGGLGERPRHQPGRSGDSIVVGNAAGDDQRRPGQSGRTEQGAPGGPSAGGAGDGLIWITDHHGNARRAPPGIRGLAHGLRGQLAIRRAVETAGVTKEETHTYSRVGALKGFGDALDLRAAKAFVTACIQILVPMIGWLVFAMLIAAMALEKGIG
jgi:DNA (cytosine-5)-methyltransferase 1